MLEDLSTLAPPHLEKQLETLARTALPCQAVDAFACDPESGLTVALLVDPRGRADVLDLARVVEDDSRVTASCGWSLLPPAGRRRAWRLLLRVSFERPAHCDLTVSLDVRDHPHDPRRLSLPLLLAASRLVFVLDEQTESDRPVLWITAPVAREPVLDLLTAVGA